MGPAPVASANAPPSNADEPSNVDEDADDSDSEEIEPPNPAREAELRWAKARFPEIGGYERLDAGLLKRLLDWAKPGETIKVYDRACRPTSVTRRKTMLRGIAYHGLRYAGGSSDEMSEGYSEVEIGWRFHTFSSNWSSYRRDSQGNWAFDGSGGFGDGGESVGHLLSAVTADAAWFDDSALGLALECGRLTEVESECTGGGKRLCERCEGWVPRTSSHEPNTFRHRTGKKRRVKDAVRVDCSAPCAPIEQPPDVKRANAALEGVLFVEPRATPPKPMVFRTEAACREYTKRHPFDREDLTEWRGDGNGYDDADE